MLIKSPACPEYPTQTESPSSTQKALPEGHVQATPPERAYSRAEWKSPENIKSVPGRPPLSGGHHSPVPLNANAGRSNQSLLWSNPSPKRQCGGPNPSPKRQCGGPNPSPKRQREGPALALGARIAPEQPAVLNGFRAVHR